MRITGVVKKIEGTIAVVELCHKDYCGDCGHHNPNDALVTVRAQNIAGAKISDKVEVIANNKKQFVSLFLVLWFPIIFSAIGAWLGKEIIHNDLGIAVAGVLFFLVAIVLVYLIGRKVKVGSGLVVRKIL